MNEPALTWNDALGLCRKAGPGHTAPVAGLQEVHDGVTTATHLCLLAQKGLLQESQALTTLRSFRAMQQAPGQEHAGCLRWYWEETVPMDTNASFFIGLALQMLYLAEGDRLPETVRAAIREIVADLTTWFETELNGDPRYPNKCLGDLACGLLSAEIMGLPPSEKLLQTTRQWCDYWRRENWGWGEHLSDIYSMVLLTELSAVLLYCHNLPDDIRAAFLSHFKNLLDIEDAYQGGPRVPLIRSYAFLESPLAMPFREVIRPDFETGDEGDGQHPAIAKRMQAIVFGPWFHRAGWHQLAPPQKKAPDWVETPCRDGAVARGWLRSGLRVGAMSHYPIMQGVEHQTWGLSWQSFPAALWRSAGDWGFWRWTTREGERRRAHPALDLHSAYLGNALSSRVDPPPVPLMTSTLTRAGHLSMERTLPMPAEAKWDEVSDEFHLLNSDAQITLQDGALMVRWPDAAVRVRWLGEAPIVWESGDRGGRWVVRYTPAQLAGRDMLVHRWELTVV